VTDFKPTTKSADQHASLSFLEDLKRQWMAMIDAVSDPLVILEEDYTILRQNRSYAQRASKSDLQITDFRGKKCYTVFAGRSSPCTHCRLAQAGQLEQQTEWQVSDELAEGHIHVIRVTPMPKSCEEEKRKFVVHYRDVSDLVTLQESLAHADKLAALGKMAGGVAHEINSPLAGILAFAQMILREVQSDDPHRDDLLEIVEAARRCKVIVENLLRFARQEKPSEISHFNLLDCLESTLRLARALMGKGTVELIYQRPENEQDFQVAGQSGKMSQVFLNLITNAIQAMHGSPGTLTIVANATEDMIHLSISDTGVGMEPSVARRAFDPFFTTKPVGQGTGLGLSISYSIIKQHGGSISIDSNPGHGTCMSIELPRTRNTEAAVEASHQAATDRLPQRPS
jgi:two-component system NtrC family sensor kinase